MNLDKYDYLLICILFIILICLILGIIDCFFSTNIYKTKNDNNNKNYIVGPILLICLIIFISFIGSRVVNLIKYNTSAIGLRREDHDNGYGKHVDRFK